jgi:alkylated DNA repair dioxygenase AlkB
MKDLFTLERQFEPISMPDSDVAMLHDIDMPFSYDTMRDKLIDQTGWRQESVKIYGKMMPQPRLIAWHGDAGMRYPYSGITLAPTPWTDLLEDIKARVEDRTEKTFNAVFLNLYRDHNDSMGFHSDDEPELGPEPVIASVSFGATRIFQMKHKANTELATVKIPLESGSVLLMQGKTQRFWKHGINKQSQPCGPRVNLTFRTIFDR